MQTKVETIVYRGIKFRRYPKIKRNNSYFTPNSSYIKKGVRNLHRYKYKCEVGEIPIGYDIHHKDGNHLNNEISNLVAQNSKEHRSYHSKKWASENKEFIKEHLAKIRDKTKEWHKSEEGHKWHKQHAIKCGFGKEEYGIVWCKFCGNEFKTKRSRSKYCSNKCKSAFRRMQGIDDIVTKCKYCGKEFKKNKYSKKECCNKGCAKKLYWKTL